MQFVTSYNFKVILRCQCPSHGHSGTNITASLPAKDNVFEIASSTVRYGPGVSREVGMDLKNLNVKKVCLVMDKNILKLNSVKTIFDSLAINGIKYQGKDLNKKKIFLIYFIFSF